MTDDWRVPGAYEAGGASSREADKAMSLQDALDAVDLRGEVQKIVDEMRSAPDSAESETLHDFAWRLQHAIDHPSRAGMSPGDDDLEVIRFLDEWRRKWTSCAEEGRNR